MGGKIFRSILIVASIAMLIFALGCTQNMPAAQNNTSLTNSSNQIVGNDSDSHGCKGSAGYLWCDALQQCIRPWETNCTTGQPGEATDSHGCVVGSTNWCDATKKCIDPRFENCTSLGAQASCNLVFQKSSIDADLVFFQQFSDPAAIPTVKCNDGKAGVYLGNYLFMCNNLSRDTQITGYLNNVQCGTLTFGGSNSSAMPPSQKSCNIDLSKASIDQGQSMLVSFSSSSAQGDKVAFACGDNTGTVDSGVASKDTSCTFGTSGTIQVSMSINGAACASKSVVVYPTPFQKTSFCSVQTTVQNYASNYFEGIVNYTGYNENDTLKWDCFGATYTRPLGPNPFGAPSNSVNATGKVTIYCQYTQKPANNDVPVTIGNDSCGSLKIRG